jgi:hypothetical protein
MVDWWSGWVLGYQAHFGVGVGVEVVGMVRRFEGLRVLGGLEGGVVIVSVCLSAPSEIAAHERRVCMNSSTSQRRLLDGWLGCEG